MIIPILIATVVFSSTHAAPPTDPIGDLSGLFDGGFGPDPLGNPGLGPDPFLGPSLEGPTPDPWLRGSQLYPEYTSNALPGIVKKHNCLVGNWTSMHGAVRYDDSFVCEKYTSPPEFSQTWINTFDNYVKQLSYRRNISRIVPFVSRHIRQKILNKQADTKLLNQIRNIATSVLPSEYCPADFPGFQKASFEQLVDLYYFWEYVIKDYKTCRLFIQKQCGSSLEFCDKPSLQDGAEKLYGDVCREQKIDVPWVTFKHRGVMKDCWVLPGQSLYYTKCSNPDRPGSVQCALDYLTTNEYVCVQSAYVKRKVWTLCPITDAPATYNKDQYATRPMFWPVLYEVVTPTACSCKHCKCCQYS
ncbi:hypothetical protein KUTeg_007468 [Tegillarca granosa]|uniref:Secreted protein n=1 Tax=Tegillarca granosa TaxID=220873 RepID=A0ABQ9FDC8_TEGGR|nr:hypothetical protein KUTeg_007468 [Tegillarca granosa]